MLEQLLDAAEIPLPEGVVAEELAGRRQEIEQQLMYAGMTMEQYLDNEKQTVDEFEAELEKRVRDAMASQFLLDEIAKAEEIGVEQDELSAAPDAPRPAVGPEPRRVHQAHGRAQPHPRDGGRGRARQGAGPDRRGRDRHRRVRQRRRPEEPASRRQHRRPRGRGRGGRRGPADVVEAAEPSRVDDADEARAERHEGLTRRGPLTAPREFSEHLFTVRRDDASTLDAAALAADYAEDLIVGTVRDVHGAVAGRVHGINDRLNGGGPTVSHRLHDGISKAVYGGISAGLRAGSSGLRAASRAGLGADIEATPRGRFVRAAVNGLIGDRLRDEGSQLRLRHGRARRRSRRRRSTATGVAAAFPDAERHGSWSSCTASARTRPTGTAPPGPRTEARREAPDRRSYGDRLAGRGLDAGLPPGQHRPADRRERRRAWRPCSTGWWRPGPSTYAGSRSWATRWAA